MHTEYRVSAMRELRDQQVRFAPREKKLEQVAAAEKLLAEIEPDRIYTYEYLCYRITAFSARGPSRREVCGREAKHDLGLFVEDLSDAANVAADSAGERVVTIEELAKRFNVSTKTISRWRRLGLISRRFVMDGRKRVGFLESSVNRFVAQNSDKVRRGSQFSQLSEAERSTIIERARRLAQAGGRRPKSFAALPGRPVAAPRRSATRSSNSTRKTPDLAIFPDNHGPIRPETKRKIYYQFHRGESAESLARRFCRTRASIYRILAEMRAEQIAELPLDYIPNDDFPKALRAPKREKRILMPMPRQ